MNAINEEIAQAANDLRALADALKTHTMSPQMAKAIVTTVLEKRGLIKKEETTAIEPVTRKPKSAKRAPLRYTQTITEQVAEIFHDFPNRAFSEKQLLGEISRRHPNSPKRSVSQTISVMKNAGLVERVDVYPSRFRSCMASADDSERAADYSESPENNI